MLHKKTQANAMLMFLLNSNKTFKNSASETVRKLLAIEGDHKNESDLKSFCRMLLLLCFSMSERLLAALLGCLGCCRRARNECNVNNDDDEFYSERKPNDGLPPPTAHRPLPRDDFQLQLVAPVALSMRKASHASHGVNRQLQWLPVWFVSWLTNWKLALAPTRPHSICHCCACCDVRATRSSWFKAVLAACHSLASDFANCCCCCFCTYARSLGRRRLNFGTPSDEPRTTTGGLKDNEITKIICLPCAPAQF